MKKQLISIYLVALMTICMLVGCGKSYASLEEYYNDGDKIPAVKEEIAKQLETMGYGDLYSDIDVEADGNTITYSYIYSDYYDIDTAAIGQSLDETYEHNIELIRKESGIKDIITIEYVYYDPDEEEVYRYSNQG